MVQRVLCRKNDRRKEGVGCQGEFYYGGVQFYQSKVSGGEVRVAFRKIRRSCKENL